MAVWQFMDFVTKEERSPFAKWLQEQELEAQAFIDARILQMAGMEKWPPKWTGDYKGHPDLIELRITHRKVPYRPLGCYGLIRREFLLLAGAIEQNGRIPEGILDSAMTRMNLAKADRSHLREHQFN